MGRRLLALGLAAALQVGALSAPLVHAHLDDHHDAHHDAARVHAHLDGHGHGHAHAQPSHTAALHEEDSPERVVRMPLFVAAQSDALLDAPMPAAPFVLAPAAESLMRRPPHVVRSHGPPPVTRSAPRAPPASSVLI